MLTTLKTINKQQFETYLATGPGGRLDGKLKNDAKNVFFISALRHEIRPKYLLHDLAALFQMGRVLRKVKPDIVHTNAPKAGVLGRLAARLFWRKAKVVHTFHGLGFAKEHGPRQFKFFVAVEKFCAKSVYRRISVRFPPQRRRSQTAGHWQRRAHGAHPRGR